MLFCAFSYFPGFLGFGGEKWGKSKWGLLSKWGLQVQVLVHNCPRLPTIVVILRRKFPLERGPKGPQKCTIVDECAQIAESGLKPLFESPHFDFPEKSHDFAVDTEIRVKLIPQKHFVAFALVLLLVSTDDLLKTHRYFVPNVAFAFAFVTLKVINPEVVLFRLALIGPV